MPRNVEIKARVPSMANLLKLAKKYSGQEGVVLHQKDYFYNCTTGRLKLRSIREEEKKRSQLIFYQRPDQDGPKLSDFHISPVEDPESMDKVLTSSMGREMTVAKRRHLFLIGQTRVHVDKVENLGDFMELEVCLRDEQTAEDGTKIANELMKLLEIDQTNLISGAYADLLAKKTTMK